jgi:hypothetical protein
MNATAMVCIVLHTQNFPQYGYLSVGSEIVHYYNTGPNTFLLDKRGLDDSLVRPHKNGEVITLRDFLTTSDIVFSSVSDKIGDDIYISPNGDIEITDAGDIRVSSGLETLDTRLRVRVSSVLGFGLNDNVGIDMMKGQTQPPEDDRRRY